MPFTQDSDLDLLFSEELVPQHLKDELPAELHVRRVSSSIIIIILRFSHLLPPNQFSICPEQTRSRNSFHQMRPLASTDYERGHLSVLSVLTQAPDVGAEAWAAQFHAMRSEPAAYYVLVIVERETDRIVGTGGVFVERKFLRGLGRVGHIEDIAVAREMQGKKLGLRIIQALTHISEDVGCYKTILNCSETNIRAFSASGLGTLSCLRFFLYFFLSAFYEKCGYEKREVEMAKYAVGRARTPRL
jgi:glucosamine-phosphate N-acetyltransferase